MIKLLIIFNLIYISIEDIKTMEIRTKNLKLLFFLESIYFIFNYDYIQIINSLLFGGVIFIIFYIFYILFKNKIGGGDVKIISIISVMYNFSTLYILLLSSIIGLVVFILAQKEKMPYVPFLTCSIIVFEIIKCYNL